MTTGVYAAGQRHLKDNRMNGGLTRCQYTRVRRNTMRIACNDVVSGCGFTASADTEEELVEGCSPCGAIMVWPR